MKLTRELFDQAPGFMAVLRGPDHVFEIANPGYRDLVGRRDIVGLRVLDALPELADQGFIGLLDAVYATGEPYIGRSTKVSLARRPGATPEDRFVDFVYQPIRDDDGAISGIFCLGHDVTVERVATETLRASQAELASATSALQAIFDHSHDVIGTVDAAGVYTRVSAHAEQVWGYRPDELVGRAYIELVHPDDVARTSAAAAGVMSGTPTTTFTNRSIHRDGTTVPIMWSAAWSEPHGVMFTIGRDLREHVEAEAKLREAQKMEAVGRLTGGIAHDFNNLLTVVIGSAESLIQGLADRPDMQPLARLILDAAERGADLVRHLLAFSRKQTLSPRAVDCNRLVASLLPMLPRTIGGNIEIEVVPAPDNLRCLADPSQLTSALLNLCINAGHAMPEGGWLTIRVAGDGDFVVLSVEDTGVGMSPEIAARALEPFFTTKAAGEGSGLGLSMAYGFVNQSGGRLEIDTAPGEGTRVRLHLPKTSQQETHEEPTPPTPAPAASRHILIVEDDPTIRSQVKGQLAALGYRVTASPDARDALDRLAEEAAIDLLLTDIVMPGDMDGRQLADHARVLRPGLPVVFTSGHNEDVLLRTGRLGPGIQYIAKPYRRAELAHKLAEAFDGG